MIEESGTFSIVGRPSRVPSKTIESSAHNNAGGIMMQRPRLGPVACLICNVTSSSASGTDPSQPLAGKQGQGTLSKPTNKNRSWASSFRRRMGLGASFVNVPHSSADQDAGASDRIDHIDFILNDALRSTYCELERDGSLNKSIDMQEANRRTDAFFDSTLMILSGSNNQEQSEHLQNIFCRECIERVGIALDASSESLLDECSAYEEAASSEEERVSSIRQILSRIVKMNSDTSGLNPDSPPSSEESAINWALDSFQREFNAITNACNEQEKELRLLQNLMQEQVNRSGIISSHEDAILQELNALELDAYNFGEESHFVSNMCSSVMSEIESMSNVKLISVPFKVDVDWDNTKCSQISGRYPQINNLRLAYRSNENAGLKRDEINSAWAQAAQLLMFACQVNNFTSPNIRLIPLSHPCAKISDRQIMNNLGWDAASISGRNRSIPMGSLVSFLTLLNQLSAHNISKGIPDTPPLPYLMTDFSIDYIDLTKLAESDVAAWSSVIFCIASNLRWLSKLP